MRKTIFITGAGSGIGKDTALALARKGHDVIATTHRAESALAMNQLAKQENLSIQSFKLDITIEEDRKLVENYDIDVLINNAGMGESGSLAEVPMDRIRANFETNVFGTIALTQHAFKKMVLKDSGRIIIISSLAGRSPRPFLGPYSMSKYCLSAAADILRQELKHISKKIHVSVVEPGSYHTGYNQKMMAKKYTWMDSSSYFYKVIPVIKKEEDKTFRLTEKKSTRSIVAKIVKATEASNPRLRWVAPWWEGAVVQIMRIFGK